MFDDVPMVPAAKLRIIAVHLYVALNLFFHLLHQSHILRINFLKQAKIF